MGDVPGTITGLTTGAGFTFSVPSSGGMSGGAYTFEYDGRSFYVGTQSSTSGSSSYGVAIAVAYFNALSNLLELVQFGNVTTSEPTNLVVGSSNAETITGSYRSDIILGGGGADVIGDGDGSGDFVWANDTLVAATAVIHSPWSRKR